MNSFIYQILFIVLIFVQHGESRSNDIPISSCQTMNPEHRTISSQPCSSKYIIQSDKSEFYTNETVRSKCKKHKSSSLNCLFLSIIVTVKGSTSKNTFTGVLLIAKTESSKQIIGNWTPVSSTVKTIDCDSMPDASITHNSRSDKISIVAIWSPPPNITEKNTIIK